MKSVKDYLQHVADCEALAKTAISDEQRQMIAKMADTWRLLARQRERHLLTQAKIEAIDSGILPPDAIRQELPRLEA